MDKDERIVDHFSISELYCAIERVKDSSLRGRPLAIAPLKSDSSRLWCLSLEAKDLGLKEGMDLAVAKRLAPRLSVIHPNPDLYEGVQRNILFELSKLTPLYERDSKGSFFADFTGFESLYGASLDNAKRVQNSIFEKFSLFPRVGVANNKLLSKAATDRSIIFDDLFEVKECERKNFLDPFSHKVIPPISEMKKSHKSKVTNFLEELNLQTVSSLKLLDLDILSFLFFDKSELIYKMLRGEDLRAVRGSSNEKTLFFETHLRESNELNFLLDSLFLLVDQAFRDLRVQKLSCSSFKIALRYSDFKFFYRKTNLNFSTNYAHDVYVQIKRSFELLFSRRTSVRYISFELGDLSKEVSQLSLFDDRSEVIEKLIDKINQRYPRKLLKGRTYD